MDFIPMDSDVLSMEIPDFFRDYFLVKFSIEAVIIYRENMAHKICGKYRNSRCFFKCETISYY